MAAETLRGKHLERLKMASEFVRARMPDSPAAAIILGSGMSELADQITDRVHLPYREIPGFHATSAGGHRGELIGGILFGRRVVVMAGRCHRYEGHSCDDVMVPVWMFAALGATRLVVGNAAGGVHPNYRVGDLVVIRDHLNLMPGVSLLSQGVTGGLGGVPGRRGTIYDPDLVAAAIRGGLENGFVVREGTYLATLGPTYETRAEYRMMRRIGADLVGMSTVPEVLAAADVGLRVVAISVVSNVANPDRPTQADHQEVIEAGRSVAAKLQCVFRSIVEAD